jgi:hypothetical protein
VNYKNVPAVLLDTCKSCNVYPTATTGNLQMVQNKRANAIDFFKDYPQFGLWIVFSVAQMVLWFILMPSLAGNVQNLNKKLLVEDFKISLWQVLGNTILPVILVGVFCWLFYIKMLGKQIITDDYFFSNFTDTTKIYAVIGYFVASLCFGTYLSLSYKLGTIDSYTKTKKLTRAGNPDLDAAYMALKTAFDNSFICSAIILSFCVIWTGIMVSAVNSTEAFRYYFLLSGKYAIPNDFVYLLGLMHTLILLIFYIPVKMKFNNLTVTQAVASDTGTGGASQSSSIFSALSDSIGPLLITISPLLASLVHSLLSLITKTPG